MPGSWLFQYALRNGGSVAAFCVTSNWMRSSFCRSSATDGLAYARFGTAGVVSSCWDGPSRTRAGVDATWQPAHSGRTSESAHEIRVGRVMATLLRCAARLV